MRWLIAAATFTLLGQPVVASAQQGFQLPSGNVLCEVMENALRCEIIEFRFARPAAPKDCDSDWGHAYGIAARGRAQVLCAGDLVVNRGLPRLNYGQRWDGTGVTCQAERSGLRCVNAEGGGLELSRSRLGLF
ncbi:MULTISPECIES: DUF6636 domain-containing protein [Roseomonadaceae]|uniref:Uncharacterized protein n=1 Tax=Falsiroseomonas oleicola TaxID=2801474 RepID=A0ABS6H9P2_9PROT|nr:DUF6636 domain-containing protein [Roseomonas oleicola]MBU8545432.1 hypothetical protein [Roseomonas oleicola]